MGIKHITVISLILIAVSGCQKKSAPAALDAEATAVPVTEIPMAETPTGSAPLSEVKCCPPRSQIQIDATNPGGSGNLGDVCVYYDGFNSAGTALTWNWLATSSKKFRVDMTAFVPTPPVPNPIVYPYPLAATCPGTQSSCSSGLILSNASAGTVYYKVTTIEANPQYFNGRIIINR